ncbi:MAG: lysylphosphatidylglycerol synthase transmembrane domain-containing protein [Candidatus Woesearchaeota archaeon]
MKSSTLINLLLLSIGIGVFIIFLHDLDFILIWTSVRTLNINAILMIIVLTLITVFIKALRWQYLIYRTTTKKISNTFSFFSIIAGIAAGSLTPGRAGEVAKPLMLKTNYNIQISKTLSCVFSERAFDLLSIICLFFIGILFLPIKTDVYNYAKILLFVFFILIILVLFVFPKKFQTFIIFVISKIITSEKLKEKLVAITENLFAGFEILKKKSVLFFVGITSLLSMVIEIIRLFFILSLFNLHLNFWLVMFAFSASVVFGLLTLVPGGIGTTEMSLALIITTLLPSFAEENLLKLVILIDRFFAYYLLTGIGGIVLLINQKWKRKT